MSRKEEEAALRNQVADNFQQLIDHGMRAFAEEYGPSMPKSHFMTAVWSALVSQLCGGINRYSESNNPEEMCHKLITSYFRDNAEWLRKDREIGISGGMPN